MESLGFYPDSSLGFAVCFRSAREIREMMTAIAITPVTPTPARTAAYCGRFAPPSSVMGLMKKSKRRPAMVPQVGAISQLLIFANRSMLFSCVTSGLVGRVSVGSVVLAVVWWTLAGVVDDELGVAQLVAFSESPASGSLCHVLGSAGGGVLHGLGQLQRLLSGGDLAHGSGLVDPLQHGG